MEKTSGKFNHNILTEKSSYSLGNSLRDTLDKIIWLPFNNICQYLKALKETEMPPDTVGCERKLVSYRNSRARHCISLLPKAKHFLFNWLFCNTFAFFFAKWICFWYLPQVESNWQCLLTPDGLCPSSQALFIGLHNLGDVADPLGNRSKGLVFQIFYRTITQKEDLQPGCGSQM